MAEDRIDSIIDIPSIQKEIDKVNELTGQLGKTLKSFPTVKVQLEGSDNFKKFSVANASLIEQTKAVINLVNQRFAADAKVITLQTDYARATAASRLEIQKQNTELKTQAQLQAANSGSIERARAAVKALTIERDKLNLFTEEGRKRQDQLNASIDKYNNFIKNNVDQLSKQKQNVGNYVGAISILKDSLSNVAQKIDQFNKAGKQNTDAAKAAQTEYTLLSKLVNSQAAGFASASVEIKANQKALMELQQAGLSGSEAFKELSKKTGDLQDSLADLKATTKNLGSDTFVFDGLLNAAQGLAGAYGVAQGAAALFGEENEELQKTFVKLQAVMTIIQGLQAVRNTLQKENTAMLLLQNVREKGLLAIQTLRNFVLKGTITATAQSTASTVANTTAIEAQTTATVASTAAARALRFALIATGIGAILLLITSAAYAMTSFSKSTKEAAESIDDFNKRLEHQKELLNDLQGYLETDQQLAEIGLKKRGAGESELHKSKMAYLEKEKKAASDAAKETEQELNRLRLNMERRRVNDKDYDPKDDQEKSQKLLDQIDEYNKAAFDKQTQMQIEQGNFEVQMADKKREADKKNKDDAAKRAKEYADRDLKAQIELTRLLLEDSKERYKKESENQELSLKERLEALKNYGIASKALIDFQEKTETDASKTPKEKELAKQKAIIATNKMAEELSNESTSIITDNYEKETAAMKKNYDQFVKIQEQKKKFIDDQISIDANNKVIAVQAEYEPKIKNASGEERVRLEKELQDKITAIDKDAELTRSENTERSLETQMAAMKLLGANTTSIEKLISDEKRKQAEIRKGIDDDEYQHWEDTNNKKRERIDKIEKYETAAHDFIVSLNSSIVEKQKNDIQDQIELNDQKSQKEIAAITASGLAQTEKDKRVMAVQKQADFQKTQLEQKQRQLDIQRAQFEKAAAITQIIIQTILQVIKAGGLLTPKGIELAAFGAIGLAEAIAQPIPHFKKGTSNAPKGPAIVSEEGRELVIDHRANKMFLTPARSSLIELMGGEEILSHPETEKILSQRNLLGIIKETQMRALRPPIKNDQTDLLLKRILRVLNDIERKDFNPTIQPPVESAAWYQFHMKR
ncbi:MAG: hypothetical protein ACTHM7_14150 [Ginsengibacter sp.]